MHDELFRWILLIGVALMFPVAIWRRVVAHVSGERLDRRREGWLMLLTLRPTALAWIAAVAVFLVAPDRVAWSAVSLPFWLRWCGAVVWSGALAVLLWTYQALGRNLTDTVVPRRDATLVTDGPYRYVRHPMYSSFLGIVVGLGLMTANWVVGLSGLAVWLLMILRTGREEAELIARFGDSYRAYLRKTGRFFPRFGSPDGRHA